jgi:hypothetical protein
MTEYTDPYERAVMQESIRELADKLFDNIRAEDAQLALDAIGMTIVRLLLSVSLKPGMNRQEVIDRWFDHLHRSITRIDNAPST